MIYETRGTGFLNPYAVIAALADPTRFAILERLATGGAASGPFGRGAS